MGRIFQRIAAWWRGPQAEAYRARWAAEMKERWRIDVTLTDGTKTSRIVEALVCGDWGMAAKNLARFKGDAMVQEGFWLEEEHGTRRRVLPREIRSLEIRPAESEADPS